MLPRFTCEHGVHIRLEVARMDDNGRDIELPSRKGLATGLLMVSAAVTVGSTVVTSESVRVGMYGFFNALVAGLIALLFGLGTISLAATLMSTRPALRVDDFGIYDNTSILGAGLIEWEEIAAISYFHFMVQGYIIIDLKDASAFARRKNVLQRAVLWINSKISPAPINMPQVYLDISPWDLLRAIRTRYTSEIQCNGIYVREERKSRAQRKRTQQ